MASARLVSCEWSNLVLCWRRLTHSTQYLQMCTFLFFKVHFAYYTWHTLLIVQSTYCTVCTLCNAQTVSHKCAICLMQNVLCTICHCAMCHVPCAMCHCALCHVPCAMYRMCFIQVSHAGQWPICQQERAIDRIFAPRSFSK